MLEASFLAKIKNTTTETIVVMSKTGSGGQKPFQKQDAQTVQTGTLAQFRLHSDLA